MILFHMSLLLIVTKLVSVTALSTHYFVTSFTEHKAVNYIPSIIYLWVGLFEQKIIVSIFCIWMYLLISFTGGQYSLSLFFYPSLLLMSIFRNLGTHYSFLKQEAQYVNVGPWSRPTYSNCSQLVVHSSRSSAFLPSSCFQCLSVSRTFL